MNTPTGYELGSAFHRDITGVYYRAVQMKLDRPVTLKVLREDLMDKPQARRVFEEERDIVTSLEHPNLLLAMDRSGRARRTRAPVGQLVQSQPEWRCAQDTGALVRESPGQYWCSGSAC